MAQHADCPIADKYSLKSNDIYSPFSFGADISFEESDDGKILLSSRRLHVDTTKNRTARLASRLKHGVDARMRAPYRESYDHVISCLGWRFDWTIFTGTNLVEGHIKLKGLPGVG